MKTVLLILAAFATGGGFSASETLDRCATDTECMEAAARHCAAGDDEFCGGDL